MMIPGALNLSGKARPMREPGDLSTWIQRSMSRIPVINEISFPRDSGYSR